MNKKTERQTGPYCAPSKGPPQFGDVLPSSNPSQDTLNLLFNRRSVVANNLQAPGPNAQQILDLLSAAIRVPDHGKLTPWRFIVFKDDARQSFGMILTDAFIKRKPKASEELTDFERARFTRAPVVIAVISSPQEGHKIPLWEQQLSAGAVCQNLLIAANATGFSCQWITEWYAYDSDVASALKLASGEKVAGFVYIGTAKAEPMERKRPSLENLVTEWKPG